MVDIKSILADKKRLAMAGSTLACIGAIGFFMQSSGQPKRQAPVSAAGTIGAPAPVKPSPVPAAPAQPPVKVSAASLNPAEPALPVGEMHPLEPKYADGTESDPWAQKPTEAAQATEVKQASNEPQSAPTELSLLDTADKAAPATPPGRDEPKTAAQCDITMSGTEVAGALIKLDLKAPCQTGERVTFHHNGMMFTEMTDAAGELKLTVPALAENAVIIASFPNSEGAVANVKATSLGLYDRTVVQSDFASGVGLHALEFGAGYDDAGHIWSEATGDIAEATIGRGGFMTLLGNPAVSGGAMAQVYTFPTGLAETQGDVALSVEIEVTSMNCGREIEAQALQIHAAGLPAVQSLDMTMPDCDAVGDFLVLKNLVDDLKVAANTH